MKMSCQIRFLQDTFLMRRVNDTAFLVFAASEVTISITCHLNTQLLKVTSMNIVDISPGCTAFANGFTFLSAIQPVSQTQHVVSIFPTEFLASLNLTAVLSNNTISGYESVDIRSLERRSKELKNIKAWDIEGHSHLTVWIIFIAIIVFLVVALVVIVVYRKKIARLIMSSQNEGMIRWSRTPTMHVAEDSYQDQIQELRSMILRMTEAKETENREEENEADEDVASPVISDSTSNHSLISLH